MTSRIGMLVTIVLLCCFASAIAGVQPPDIPPRPLCRRGERCPGPFPINVCGLRKRGPRCRPGLKCPLGFTCILGQCCGERRPPPPLPLPCDGPRCHKYRLCKSGYTCQRRRCCRNRCPKGQIQGPICSKDNRCKSGYYCNKGVCCRGWITIGGGCPPLRPGTAGICVELCNNCEARGMVCCSNGCGHVCKRPVKFRGFCPMGVAPHKFPRCPMLATKIPPCTTDKDCRKNEKCCRDICGQRRRCMRTMSFPPV